MCQRVLRGITVTDDTLATDLIMQKPPGETFIDEPHTIHHMRNEFFTPQLANREKRESMDHSSDALFRAKEILNRIISENRSSCLPLRIREQIVRSFPEIIHSERD